jgi:hypothetical protein
MTGVVAIHRKAAQRAIDRSGQALNRLPIYHDDLEC